MTPIHLHSHADADAHPDAYSHSPPPPTPTPTPSPTPTPTPTPTPPPLVTMTSIRTETNKKHLVTEIIVGFSGALNAGEADSRPPTAWPPPARKGRSPPRTPR